MPIADLKTLMNASAQNLSQFKGLSAAYGILLGGTPSIDGYTNLINNNNTTNFGSGPTGPKFNDENIYINTINALYQGNQTAKTTFDGIVAGSASIQDALTAVYNFVIPASARTQAGLDYFKAQASFYAAKAAELGVAGTNGTALVAFASLTKIAVDNDIGGLGDTLNDLVAAVNDGSAAIPQGGTAFTPLETADGANFDVDDVSISQGKSFTLTNGVDTGAPFKGTTGSDVYTAALSNDQNGAATVETLNALDNIDGGAGEDTLTYFTDNGVAVPGATLTSIETLNVISGADVTADVSGSNITGLTTLNAKATGAGVLLTTKSNATSIAVTGTATTVGITDTGTAATTADKLATVSISGNTGVASISSDALTTLSLTKTNQNATVTAAAGPRTLTVNLNEVTGGTVSDGTATTLSVNASGVKSSAVTLTAGAATAVTLDATKVTLGVNDVNIGAAKTLTVTGDSAVTIGATSAVGQLTNVSSAASTGGVTITPTLATGVTFTGGAGKDNVSLTAGTVKASTLGAGDDSVTLTGAFGSGGSVDGGDGVDTLKMASADAATVSATTTFKTGFTNFEKLSLGAVAGSATDTVQLANLNNLNYVVSAGTTAGVPGSFEVSDVTFSSLKSGQSVTFGGRTITATGGDLTAAQVEAAAISGTTAGAAVVSGTLTGFTAVDNGTVGDGIARFTATTAGNVTDIATSVANSTTPAAPTATTTQGVAAVTESSTVNFVGLIAGEAVTVAGRTVNAGTFETAVYTAASIGNGETITVGGFTLTSTGGHTDAQVITVLTGGTVAGLVRTGTLDPEYTLSGTSATTATFTRTILGNDLTDIAVGGTDATPGTVTVTDGGAVNLTAANVATLAAGGAVTGASVTGTLTGYTAGAAAGNAVTFTSTTANTNVPNIVVSTTAGVSPTVTTTDGVPAVTEFADVTFSALKSGQTFTVAGRTVTANGVDLTAVEVENAFATGAQAGATVGGALAGFTAATNVAADGIVRFTSTGAGNVADITTSVTGATAPTGPTAATTQGGVGSTTGGILNVTGFGADGTFELTNSINGASSLALANSSGTADVLNIKLNGTSNIVNTAATTIANVETIKITTTDSQVVTSTQPTDIDPTAASTILLNAAQATKIVVSGNHGIDFTGSTLTALVELDASGVAATGIAAANQSATTTATNIGTAGAVTFSSAVTDKAVIVTTGNGNDVINVSSINNAAFLATNVTASTISTGAGNDTVTGSAGKDVINTGIGNDTVRSSAGLDTYTLGAGNDTYVLLNNTDSVIARRDVITDFSANTFGQGVNGAVNSSGATATLTSRTGDVINIDAVNGGLNTIRVGVFANAADAQTFVQNGTTDAVANVNAALDSTTGFLYLDTDDNGVVDSVIELTGVTTINAAAFVLV